MNTLCIYGMMVSSIQWTREVCLSVHRSLLMHLMREQNSVFLNIKLREEITLSQIVCYFSSKCESFFPFIEENTKKTFVIIMMKFSLPLALVGTFCSWVSIFFQSHLFYSCSESLVYVSYHFLKAACPHLLASAIYMHA